MESLGFIEDIQSYTVIKRITDGYSGDEKYKLEKGGKYFLLRIGDMANLSEKEKEFERLKAYSDKKINTHKPVAFGTVADKYYSVVTWVDGTPIMDIIKNDVSKNYYELGRKVGVELKKLHSYSPNCQKADWREIIEKKATLFLENYHHMNIAFTCGKYAEQYILENICLMSNRPQALLHGDFHWENCVVDEAGNVGIIDFGRNIVGDPWYDFGGLLWALEYSNSFANGQIDGYFNVLPNEFWKVFKFYTALYAFEHLMYSNDTEGDIKKHVLNAERMINVFGENYKLDTPIFRKH